MVVVKSKGSFKNTEKFLKHNFEADIIRCLKKYGEEGVAALASATPVDSGITANSWGYEINISRGSYTISWTNSNIVNGVPIAIILQYGHATRNGGYVIGSDYINPAIKPIFEKMANDVWREVRNA